MHYLRSMHIYFNYIQTMLISIPEERWLLHSTQKLFKAFFGCVYLEQHSRLKRIAYSFVFVMLLKEKMRYWLKADYVKKPFFCHLQKINHKNALSTYYWFILSFNNIFDVFFLCIFEVRRFLKECLKIDITRKCLYQHWAWKVFICTYSLRTLHCVCDMNGISIWVSNKLYAFK